MSYNDEHAITDEALARTRRFHRTQDMLDAFIGQPNVGSDGVPHVTTQRYIVDYLESLSRLGAVENGKGMTQSFIDGLDRVDKKELTSDDECAVCSTSYLDQEYPLVVQLPCPGHHRFDLECVAPWLERNSTCPACRHDMYPVPSLSPVEVESSEIDEMFY